MISFNQIKTVHPRAFFKLGSLSTVFLNHNYLQVIPKNLFQDSPKLKEVTLHQNLLTSIPEALNNLSNIQTVDLIEEKSTSHDDLNLEKEKAKPKESDIIESQTDHVSQVEKSNLEI